ncbi:hypothetical protein ACFFKU_06970 [Kineococcus gynurae]|uniref:Uncharacterized protein n=1 Tax=Kineococcus gynurae TaxID=452979 RepID=A0ABV5LWV9_9ACTN
MARDFATIRLDLWAEDTFLALSVPAQWLYLRLLAHPSTSFCGVADFRPRRLAVSSETASADAVTAAAHELVEAGWAALDEDTEEILLRRFLRDDGVLTNPNLSVAAGKDFFDIASRWLRGIVVHDLRNLHAARPHLAGWARLQDVLRRDGINPDTGHSTGPDTALDSPRPGPDSTALADDANPSGSPSGGGSRRPSGRGSARGSTSPSGSPSVRGSGRGSVSPFTTVSTTPSGRASGTPSASPSANPSRTTGTLQQAPGTPHQHPASTSSAAVAGAGERPDAGGRAGTREAPDLDAGPGPDAGQAPGAGPDPEERGDSRHPTDPADLVDPADLGDLGELVDELVASLAGAGLTARWDRLDPAQLREVADLADHHGVQALTDAAVSAHRPSSPAGFAQAWLGIWRRLTTPTTTPRAQTTTSPDGGPHASPTVPASPACPEHSDQPAGRCLRCAHEHVPAPTSLRELRDQQRATQRADQLARTAS